MSLLRKWRKIEPKIGKLPYLARMINSAKKYGFLLMLEVYKRLPKQERKLAQPVGVVQRRYYTLRQVSTNHDAFTGEVDIYIHENTQGSSWAESLQVGDTIYIDNHYEETIKNMTIGQPLFICDETSMPTVAAMLEQWQYSAVPIVISVTNEKADFDYFSQLSLPENLQHTLHIDHIDASKTQDIAKAAINIIKQHNKNIDCAWGALGAAHYRPIKMYLRETYGLKGRMNRIRAYWA